MSPNGQHSQVPAYMAEGAQTGGRAVMTVLAGQRPDLRAGKDHARAAASFISYVMYTVQMANGLHPSSAIDFLPGDGRGEDLARGVLTTGTADICCDYCGQLMAEAITGAAASQMHAVHGPAAAEQWDMLMHALTPVA